MRRSLVTFAALVAFAAIVVALAPATLASVAVERASNGLLTLAETDGTLWNGSGTLAAGGKFRLPLAWTVDPWRLLRGALGVQLAIRGAAPGRADITSRRGAMSLRDVDIVVPVAVVNALAPRAGARIGGNLHVVTGSLDWTPAAFVGGLRIDWRDAQFAIGNDPAVPLGNVGTLLTAAGARLTGNVANDGSAFDVKGTLAISTSGAPAADISMMPRGGDAALARRVAVGTDPSGNWTLQLRIGPP